MRGLRVDGIGMIPVVSPQFFSQLPVALQPLLHSGILLATVSAVGLNYYFNGYHPERVQPNCQSPLYYASAVPPLLTFP